jgi:carbonic anhydrase/acetyltransferase-like protein (isoleucine patch superfamily)
LKALITASDRKLELLGDAAAEVPILGTSLRARLEHAILRAGLERVDAAPSNEPYLVVSDRTFVTEQALRAFVSEARAGDRFEVDHPGWLELTGPLQKLDAPGRYEIGIVPAGAPPSFAALTPRRIDLDLHELPVPQDFVPFFEHGPKTIPVSDRLVHQVDHWTHVLRVNWLALGGHWVARRRAFRTRPWWWKLGRAVKLLSRARSLNRSRLAAALTEWGSGCSVHPTAVVEASLIGDGVEIGAHAIVRGAFVGDGVKIGDQASVTNSVLGANVRVGRGGVANLCVAYPGAVFGAGNGYQATLFGRDSFLAWSATIFDLSFGEQVKVTDGGQRVPSGTWFLGACIGHRARVGGLVVLGYGAEVPNDAVVVGPIDQVLRRFEPGPGPHRVADGIAKPLHAG